MPRDQLDDRIKRLLKSSIVIEEIAAAKIDQPLFERFADLYFDLLSPEELEVISDEQLLGKVLSHLQVVLASGSEQTKVDVYHSSLVSDLSILRIVVPDNPFLLDSVTMKLNDLNLDIRLVIHPVVAVKRNRKGKVVDIVSGKCSRKGYTNLSLMHFELEKSGVDRRQERIVKEIRAVLKDVAICCEDWQPIVKQLDQVNHELKQAKTINGLAETSRFIKWLQDDNFIFLGYCKDSLSKNRQKLNFTRGSGLGLLRQGHKDFLPAGTAGLLGNEETLVVAKSNQRSHIHRAGYLDFLGINRYNKQGKIVGQYCFLGLFTSTAYNKSALKIPLVSKKARFVLEQSNLPKRSHDYKTLIDIIENYPRDNLFAIDNVELQQITHGILSMQERKQVRFFMNKDRYSRFYTCLVYIPRNTYNRDLRKRIEAVLLDALRGRSIQAQTYFSHSVLARVQFIVRVRQGSKQKISTQDIEQRLQQVARTWEDMIAEEFINELGENKGRKLAARYGKAYRPGYQSDFSARSGVLDAMQFELLGKKNKIGVQLYQTPGAGRRNLRMKLFALGETIAPSQVLPVIENLGLRVMSDRPYRLELVKHKQAWVHEFHMQSGVGVKVKPTEVAEDFQGAFMSVWRGQAENDSFNKLIVSAGLNWREVVILRAYSRYLRQLGLRYSESYVVDCLLEHAEIARQIIDCFRLLFDPLENDERENQAGELQTKILAAIDTVVNLDHDRILRRYLNLVECTLRTNYFQLDAKGKAKDYVSFKFDSNAIDGMPEPKPLYEIFVYSPRVEGVHLRGGRVARGGLRWSDRREDFRTEVLGLVKAQMVKNTVIVPTGSKGGFYVKQPPQKGGRAAFQREGIACYKTFISGLLDVTDNLIGNDVVPPNSVVRRDGDDPYLVVAADKGTATFSDIANAVAKKYKFWLGDAFASGGSVGYDHKAMGITARGAWESVKRHFLELEHNIQKKPFTAVGIGDMAGDVFGNGMLLSRQTKLVAAFNHLHIFIDPDPNPEKSYRERERLFKKPKSAWTDYNNKLLSKGGGVFERSAKSIQLSAEAKAALGINASELTPNELIHRLLKAPVDLLWNGGIGTYIKSSVESQADAKDRANDVLRVDGKELRCKVLGEGGNLGATQAGRIEFCQNGGRCYTDFIDNSAGVDTSDHEVNIKILLNAVREKGGLNEKQRNKLLASMTDEVAELVLDDNYQQSLALNLEQRQAGQRIREHARFIDVLEEQGVMKRELEGLATREELEDRYQQGQPLCWSELAVILAYSKIQCYEKILASDLPDDPFARQVVEGYFPKVLVKKYRPEIVDHRLRKEIVATELVNKVNNRCGPIFVFRIAEMTGHSYANIIAAFTCAWSLFELDQYWEQVSALDNIVPVATQASMYRDAIKTMQEATIWLLYYRPQPLDIMTNVAAIKPVLETYQTMIAKSLSGKAKQYYARRLQELKRQKVPASLVQQAATMRLLPYALDVVDIATNKEAEVAPTTEVYYAITGELKLYQLSQIIEGLTVENHWHLIAQHGLKTRLLRTHALICADIIAMGDASSKDLLRGWKESNKSALQRFLNTLDSLKLKDVDFEVMTVLLSDLEALRQSFFSVDIASTR